MSKSKPNEDQIVDNDVAETSGTSPNETKGEPKDQLLTEQQREAVEAPENSVEPDAQSDAQSAASEEPSDPFADIESWRLSQDFGSMASVKPVFTTISVRKPHRQEFIRVRPGDKWRFEAGCFTDKQTGETYLVTPDLWMELSDDLQPTALFVVMSRNSPVPFLWPCKLPGPDGRPNRWHESALEAAKLAESDWLKVVSDMDAGCYVPHVACGNLAEPEWPEDLSMFYLVKLAFKERLIDSPDHPVLRRLRGEA